MHSLKSTETASEKTNGAKASTAPTNGAFVAPAQYRSTTQIIGHLGRTPWNTPARVEWTPPPYSLGMVTDRGVVFDIVWDGRAR